AGIPVITINSGLEASKELGALDACRQPEYDAGFAAGTRAKEEGATKPLCLNQEAFNTALVDRCQGYFDAMGLELNMIDVSNDVAQIQTRTAAALLADTTIDSLLATGPHVCEAAASAVAEAGSQVHLSCFDLTPGVISMIEEGKVAYTIDQQQRLQGYMPVVVLHLYNTNAGMLPGNNVNSGPGFVDKSNAAGVAEQAGTNR
ncbi:MAG: substrate-binding domain-containing protein, partial [Rhizobiales bacterium]|nr:substrate-binding domain-containing protein [Hyphomicrobiales bacterium]